MSEAAVQSFRPSRDEGLCALARSALPDSGNYNRDLRELVLDGYVDFDTDRPVYTYCPAHADNVRPSLAVYEDHAFCYTCRVYFSAREFSSRFSPLELTAAKLQAGKARSKARTPVNPQVLADTAHGVLMSNPDKLAWLAQRGIDRVSAALWRIGHNGMAYTLPVFGSESEYEEGWEDIVSVRFRRDDVEMPDGHKYWGLRGLNEPRWYPFPPRYGTNFVLTEGEFDTLLLRRYGVPAFTITNGCEAGFDLIAKAAGEEIMLCRDQDESGVESTEHLIEFLGEKRPDVAATNLTWRETSGKDITAVWQHNPGLFDRILEFLQRLAG